MNWRLGIIAIALLIGACSSRSEQSATSNTAPQMSIEQQRAIEALRPKDVKLAAKYSRSCFMCHATPDAKAPLTHDRADWDKRLKERGWDGLLEHAKTGFNAMPPMGQCADCSDAELKALIQFMANQTP